MTVTHAVQLIEQFATQAPFAVWITDSRGVSIFANRKLHELLTIPEHPSGALGFNLFEDAAIKKLGLVEIAAKARNGEPVDAIIDIPESVDFSDSVISGHRGALTVRLNCYALRSSAQRIEHYVLMLTDVTEISRHREELRAQLRDLAIYNKSREARIARLHELEEEVLRLEKEVRERGAEPES